MERRLVHVMFN